MRDNEKKAAGQANRLVTSRYLRGSLIRARTAKLATETRKRQETRDARIAEVEVRATTVTVRPPYRQGRKLPEVKLNIVLAEEPNPPEGATPIQWLLVTTLPIDNPEQVQQIVSYYSTRWQIETVNSMIKRMRVQERTSAGEAGVECRVGVLTKCA